MRPVLLEAAVTASVWTWLLAPEVIPDKLTVCRPAFSLKLILRIELRVGGWLVVLIGISVDTSVE